MHEDKRIWLRGILRPLETDPPKVSGGPPNFSRYGSHDDVDAGKKAYYTWIRVGKQAWTLVLRCAEEFSYPIDQTYEVEVLYFQPEDAPIELLVRNKPITVGVRCPAGILEIYE